MIYLLYDLLFDLANSLKPDPTCDPVLEYVVPS